MGSDISTEWIHSSVVRAPAFHLVLFLHPVEVGRVPEPLSIALLVCAVTRSIINSNRLISTAHRAPRLYDSDSIINNRDRSFWATLDLISFFRFEAIDSSSADASRPECSDDS